MSLPAAAPQRQLKHRRQIDVQVYSRGDGTREVDATLIDTKSRPVPLASDQQPFQIDRCHALRSDGDAVRMHFPRWHRAPAPTPCDAPSPTED